MQSWLELPALYGATLFYRMEKAGNHKYIKRVPTGNPRRPYRYYYNVAHGLGVAAHEHMVEGASFKHGGGHWHIKHVDGDKLHIEHDESKEAKSINKSDLADMLRSEHSAALKEHETKKAAELEDVKQHGSDKQRVRAGLKTKDDEAEAQKAEPPKREPRTTAFEESEAAVPAFKPPESAPGLSAKASDLSYETAKNAHAGSSFVPERRARQEQAGYVEAMQTMADKLGKFATPENTAQIKAAFDEYKRDYLKHMHAKLAADSRTMSSMITGPSNFPTHRNEKRLNTAHNRLTEFLDWKGKAEKRINAQFNPATKTAISSDDADAAGKIDKKLEALKTAHEQMKQANAIIRGKGTEAEKIAKMVGAGIKESMAKQLLEPDQFGRPGFPSHRVTSVASEIKRLEERTKHMAKESATPTREHAFDGGRIVDDADENRVQIFYDSKPDAETIAKLKSRGFKWAPTQGAWQRLRNNAARYAAGVVTGAKMGDEADISKALSSAMAGWKPMAKAEN